ncbi:MAG TPA: acyl-CoA thioesterase domain-containing protein [Marmoricola sp.]|jgi:hypothetical protein|nr:acyl-CoA thioesterase domain-containing protein [Marmoricola sp.]
MTQPRAELSFFERDDNDQGALVPTAMARSLWRDDQMHGVATSGALARRIERTVSEAGRGELVPARYTVDLFRPASMEACRTTATIVREGPRLVLVDAVLSQRRDGADVPVARASCLFLAPSTEPAGHVWEPSERPGPPPLEVVPVSQGPHVPWFGSEESDWSQDFRTLQNPGRKATWQTAVPLLVDEEVTPFQAVASIADSTSMVTNWGSRGVEHINCDITLTLARRPAGTEIGIAALDRVSSAGIAVGTAQVYDRQGPLGTSLVTSLANARRTVDFTEHDFTGSGA